MPKRCQSTVRWRYGYLEIRIVDGAAVAGLEGGVLHVGGHTHDRHPLRPLLAPVAPGHALAERALAAEQIASEALVDDRHLRRLDAVLGCERAAREDADAEGAEIVADHRPRARAGLAIPLRGRSALDQHAIADAPARLERRADHDRGRLRARQGRERFHDPGEGCGLRRPRAVAGLRQHEVRAQDPLRLEAQLHVLQLREHSQQQARPDQDHAGQRHLGDDETREQAGACRVQTAGPPGAQALRGIAAEDLKGRRQPG